MLLSVELKLQNQHASYEYHAILTIPLEMLLLFYNP